MLTFQQIHQEVQEQVQDANATSLVVIKRAINQGHKKFAATLHRDYRVSYKTFSTVADQQYYQMPEDCIRPKSITITIGSVTYPLTEVADEQQWQLLNMRTTTADRPSHYYVRGNDEFGIYPIPATSTASAGKLAYERRVRDMSADDYTTGTITLTNNSATVTGSGTTFTAQMVGRYLRANDPSGDGMWYKIASYVSATEVTLEQTYSGTTTASLNYTIGELPDIPEEYHESLVDYACFRYYLRRRDRGEAKDFKALYENALEECRGNYSSKTQSQYSRARHIPRGEHPWQREPDIAS